MYLLAPTYDASMYLLAPTYDASFEAYNMTHLVFDAYCMTYDECKAYIDAGHSLGRVSVHVCTGMYDL